MRNAICKFLLVNTAAVRVNMEPGTKFRYAGGGTTITAPKVSAETLIPFEHLSAGNISKAMEGYREIKRATPDNAGSLNNA